MVTKQYAGQKKKLIFSKNQINEAARAIRHGVTGDERLESIKKIQNFREYHLYPLMLIKNHLSRTSRIINDEIIVARRLKRLPTIIDKLERETLDGTTNNHIKLTRMQDIAGCRAIVKDLDELNALWDKLNSSRSVHKIIKPRSYLTPKPSGYSGVHLIYECYNGQAAGHEWKGAKVEVQLRTQLQHDWATSLEIIDTLEQIRLKTSHTGEEKWREFFSLAGILVANKEGACTYSDNFILKTRFRAWELFSELGVSEKLVKYSMAISTVTSKEMKDIIPPNGKGMLLVMMDNVQSSKLADDDSSISLDVSYFSPRRSSKGLEALNEAELRDDLVLCVLLSVSDAKTLQLAYPNYFGSTSKFSDFMDQEVEQCKLQLDKFMSEGFDHTLAKTDDVEGLKESLQQQISNLS
ncbi:(P)ppGpp synthetase [Vibrio chagasii]|nr:(P)ppGpp synthetase [Vibrio chagasii]